MSKRRIFGAIGAATLAIGLLAAGPTFAAKSGVNVGTLDCRVAPGVGLVVGSSKAMDCVFRRGNGRVERYVGRVTRVGVDIGITGEGHMAWLVFAPGSVKRGALAGGYAGASAEASAGVGLGANVLVGGFKRSITLQPISIKGQTGLNIAAGIAGLSLKRG